VFKIVESKSYTRFGAYPNHTHVFNSGLLARSRFASIRSCDRPTRSRFSLLFFDPRANTELAPKFQVSLQFQILKTKLEYNETVHQLFIDFKKAYDTVRREVLCNILTEFGVPMKLVRLIKMCLNEIYSKVHIGKHLFESFPNQNGLK
jgi:hypothetical protein